MALPDSRTITEYGSYAPGSISKQFNGTLQAGRVNRNILFGQFVTVGGEAKEFSTDADTPLPPVIVPDAVNTTSAPADANVKFVSGVAVASPNATLKDSDGNIIGYATGDEVIYGFCGYFVVLCAGNLTFATTDAVTIDANGFLSNRANADGNEAIPNLVVTKFDSADLQQVTLPYNATGGEADTTYKLAEVRMWGAPAILGQGE